MEGSKSFYQKFSDNLDKVARLFAQLSVFVMVIVVLMGVFMRYFIKNPLVWSDELAKYTLVYMTFIGASVALKDKNLAAMDLVVTKLPKRAMIIVQIIVYILEVVLLSFLFYYSIDLLFQNSVRNQISPGLQIPMSWVYFSMPLGFGITLLQAIFLLVDEIKGYKNNMGGIEQ